MSGELQPPSKGVELRDPGAHELAESSDGSEDFTDASEGIKPISTSVSTSIAGDVSPIPVTRVERVDDEPSYGEVPGTAAYSLRTADAVPDEIEVLSEGQRSRSHSRLRSEDRPVTPTGSPVPKIVAEKIDDDKPAYGDVPGTAAFDLRKADAQPDEIIKSPVGPPPNDPWNVSPTASISRSEPDGPPVDEVDDVPPDKAGDTEKNEDDHEDDDGFGDDFDDFEEGQEGDDFGEFDDGFQQSDDNETLQAPAPPLSFSRPLPFSIPNFSDLSSHDNIRSAIAIQTDVLFPLAPSPGSSEFPRPNPQIFLSDRSHSLYSQLIAPPPLAPPNWLRSRIRRLFLVSLGVPVDLDEILPASKQKKLILPSMHLNTSDKSPRPSSDNREAPANGAVSRLKGSNDSSASIDSKGNRRRRKDEIQQPQLDLSEALRLGGTTEVKLIGLSDKEMQDHIAHVQAMIKRADEVLKYWEGRREGAIREKEAFEGVIENLVKHARKVRK